MIASNACSGLIPLLPGFCVGFAGSGFVLWETWERKPTVDAPVRAVRFLG